MRVQFFINDIELDISDGEAINFPVTYAIADIKHPERRKRSASKTIRLPGSSKNRLFFKSGWDLHITDVYDDLVGFDFDPTFRYSCYATRNGREFFRGTAWLQKTVMINDVPEFHVAIFSEIANLIQRLGDLTLAELGWSEYDHVLSVANIQASWIAATGSGYVYPLIDFGYTENTLSYLTNELLPYVYEKEIVEKCFQAADYNLSSSFYNTALQRKVIFGLSGGDLIGIDATEKALRDVNYTADGSRDYSFLPATGFEIVTISPLVFEYQFTYNLNTPIADSPNMTFTLVDDDLSQFNPSLGELTVANSGKYQVQLSGDLTIQYFRSSVTGSVNWDLLWRLEIYKNGAWINWQEIDVLDTADGSTVLNFDITQEIDADAGDVLTFRLYVGTYKTTTDFPNEIGIIWDWNNTFVLDFQAIDSALVDGDTVQLARFLPKMKAADFIQDQFIKYNLYMSDPDPDQNLLFVPIDDYYFETDDVDQWSDKRDKSKPMEIMAAQNIEGKEYVFKFAQDMDYYKQKYFEQVGEQYGDKVYNVPSTYKKGQKVYELMTASSCPVQIEGTDIIIPRIVKYDESTEVTSPHKGKPRTFFYNGLVASDDWSLVNSDTGAVTTLSSYPQAHHQDSLTAPTMDLLFGPPRMVFYTATVYEFKNLFSTHYAKFIRELTGRDSKVVQAYFRLTEADMYENFQRRLCNVDGVLYRKNIVKDFLATRKDVTLVELVRIVEGNSIPDYQIAAPALPAPPIDGISDTVDHTSSPSTPTSSKSFIPIDTTGGAVDIFLDPSTMRKGKEIEFKWEDGTPSNKVEFTPQGGAEFEGSTSPARMVSVGDSWTIRFDGTNFFLV